MTTGSNNRFYHDFLAIFNPSRFINKVKKSFARIEEAQPSAIENAATVEPCPGQQRFKFERSALKQAVEQLPADLRSVFVLHDSYGYNHDRIAEKLGIN